jgi:hypothetical protein
MEATQWTHLKKMTTTGTTGRTLQLQNEAHAPL